MQKIFPTSLQRCRDRVELLRNDDTRQECPRMAVWFPWKVKRIRTKTSENSSISTSLYSTGDLTDASNNGNLTANHVDTLENERSIAARPLTKGHSTADYDYLVTNR